MLCPNCESENREGAKFCDECGFPLIGVASGSLDASRSGAGKMPLAENTETIDAQFADAGPFDSPTDLPEETNMYELGEDQITADDAVLDSDAAKLDQLDESAASAGDAEIVDVDSADGNSIEDADADVVFTSSETQILDSVSSDNDPDATAVLGRDLSGFDRSYDYGERLAGPDDEIPEVSFRDGGTMEMPRIEGEEAPKSKDFLASSTTKQKNTGRKVAFAVIGVVVVAAIIVFATYQMQLWGGKAVPNVKGLTEVDATSVLNDNGFEVRSTQVKSDDTEGLVLISDPEAGSRVEEGSEIVIHVATARIIPDIVGKKQDEAKSALDEEGFENVKYEKKKSDEPEGTVLSVAPEKGSRALSTNEIVVSVADPYIVPDVAGMFLDDARSAIEQAGLTSEVIYVYSDMYVDGTIVGTDPGAGTQVHGDTIVAIQLAQSRGVLLEGYAASLLAPGQSITIGMVNYEIQSLNSVSYAGNNTVSYSVTARPYASLLGERAYLGTTTLQGQIVYDEANQLISIS